LFLNYRGDEKRLSFSSKVKSELLHHFGEARHCNIAEIAAIINCCGDISEKNEKFCVKIHTENVAVARKYFTLLKNTFNIECEMLVKRNNVLKKNRVYIFELEDNEEERAKKVLMATGILRLENGEYIVSHTVSPVVISSTCCKRAFIRGAFLASGSVSDPEKNYHVEFVCNHEQCGEQLKGIINYFGMDSKMIKRKEQYVVYIKEGEQIADLLNVMEAHVSLMDMENVRILKDMRNNVNRKVNCETANLKKTIAASVKHMEDIVFIRDNYGLEYLPKTLEEMAEVRLKYPDASLKELGEMMDPKVGKSGVNHRLRKISIIAEGLREGNLTNG
jgi:DNA-binding protein WhiA